MHPFFFFFFFAFSNLACNEFPFRTLFSQHGKPVTTMPQEMPSSHISVVDLRWCVCVAFYLFRSLSRVDAFKKSAI